MIASEIVNEGRSITADTAERLAHYFGGDAASWLNLQAIYDLKTLKKLSKWQKVDLKIKDYISKLEG